MDNGPLQAPLNLNWRNIKFSLSFEGIRFACAPHFVPLGKSFFRRTIEHESRGFQMASQSEDQEMADATGGAQMNGSANGEFIVEKQRLRVVCH